MGAGTLPYTTGAGTPVERRHSLLMSPTRASRDRLRPFAIQRFLGHRVTDELAQRFTQRRQQLVGRQRISGRRRVEHVVGEQHLRRLAELRRQQVGERHRHAARRPDGRRLGARQAQARVRATQRSGCGIAVITPKSGQVPTTTTAPLARSRRTARPSRRADGPMPFGLVMSLAPIMITAASGGGPATNIASTWPDRPFEVAPTIALVLNRMRLPDCSASPRAISTPGTSSALTQP